jgi:hypothetical protein
MSDAGTFLEQLKEWDYDSMISKVNLDNQDSEVVPKYQYQGLITKEKIIAELKKSDPIVATIMEGGEDIEGFDAIPIAEIRMLWNQEEKYRTVSMLKDLADLENRPPWEYFKGKPKLQNVVFVLVEWWQEISTTSDTNDWSQNKYIAFSRWIKHYIPEESLHQGFDLFYRYHAVDGSLLIQKFPDYYWNKCDWTPNDFDTQDLHDLIRALRKNQTPKKVKDWIYSQKIGELANEYFEVGEYSSKDFIRKIISHRLGGIDITPDFISKLSRMNDLESKNEGKQFTTELLGLFIDQDDLRSHFNNPLALDIGTPFLNLSDLKNDSVRKQKIRNATARNIGMYSFEEGGIVVDPHQPLDQRLEQIRERLKKSDILIGFNLWDFDLEVLKGKGLDIQKEFPSLVIYDIMRAIYGKHSSVRTKLSDLLIDNGLTEKDSGSNRDVAAMNDSWSALGCFFLLTAPSFGLKWKDTRLRTDIFEGIHQLREIKDIISERNSYEVKIEAWIAEHLK